MSADTDTPGYDLLMCDVRLTHLAQQRAELMAGESSPDLFDKIARLAEAADDLLDVRLQLTTGGTP